MTPYSEKYPDNRVLYMKQLGIQPGDGRFDALYVHIPFCFHKCHYCDFYSITGQSPARMERFVDLLLAEADRWANWASAPIRPRTIFFGGGTPSLLPFATMQRLLVELKKRFDFSRVDEWTIEVNPATADQAYCAMLRQHGVDRLSFGAQSFNRAELATLERHHDPDDIPHSLDLARRAGFQRLNIDLIFAIPGQGLDSWIASLHSAVGLQTEHLSCYALTYEPNTPITVRKRLGRLRAADEDLELTMLHQTRRILSQAGFNAYEISNFALPGRECRHNLLYWNGGNYLALGPAGASHLEGTRWRNRPHLGEWESVLASGQLPAVDIEHLSPRRRAGELAMLQLRLADGIDFDDFAGRTGLDARSVYAGQIRRLADLGLLCVQKTGFCLTNAGLNVADSVAAEFLDIDLS